ncbi:MAG: Holliday junction branch migration protein RuvA [Lachnospiraceae bacterium]|jgi:Holliday junction DNA helicase RuvA|nr:Holliday junction branch migration protein RuvA [Lachnospiraceae bacterium]MCI1423235.1 Holliday junction branch migration protein RuvA [Lachnospiraceae bacterium]MCI1452090.1 Holliday junction branch migration protein RuvA [Lachnospiraceae bacterium]
MISFLNGTIAEIGDGFCVIDVGGVGYEVLIPGSTQEELVRTGIGETVKLFTYLYLREDALCLYGFTSRDDLALFKKLITVSGIGPRGGLSLLTALSSDELIFAILTGDSKTISKAPGIGKKTAERICIDLRDKLSMGTAEDFASGVQQAQTPDTAGFSGAEGEAIEALEALGYSRAEAAKAVRKAQAEDRDADTETLLKGALRYL